MDSGSWTAFPDDGNLKSQSPLMGTQMLESQPPISEPEPILDSNDLLYKIEKWWILNVEVPTNPDFDGKDIDEDSIVPGKIMAFRLLADIALGSEEESKIYYEELMKRKSSI